MTAGPYNSLCDFEDAFGDVDEAALYETAPTPPPVHVGYLESGEEVVEASPVDATPASVACDTCGKLVPDTEDAWWCAFRGSFIDPPDYVPLCPEHHPDNREPDYEPDDHDPFGHLADAAADRYERALDQGWYE